MCFLLSRPSDIERLHLLCATKNWQVVNVPADGHCMFSALAIQLGRPLAAAQDVRRELVEYIRINPNTVSQIVEYSHF